MRWADEEKLESERDRLRAENRQLREAANNVMQAVISSGSGPAAPCFDEHDRAVEGRRGKWYKVDGQAIDDLRAALSASAKHTEFRITPYPADADADAQPDHVAGVCNGCGHWPSLHRLGWKDCALCSCAQYVSWKEGDSHA